MESELPIIIKVYDLYKQLMENNLKLSKLHRYSIGQSAEQTVMSTLEHLIMAKYAPRPSKAKYLILGTAQIETLRFKLRIYLELKLISETKIFQMQSNLREIARMATGWRKSLGG